MPHRVLLAVMFWTAFATAFASADVIISFNPNIVSVGVGDHFSLDIAANIPESEALVGWGLDYVFATPGIAIQNSFEICPDWDPAVSTPDGDGLAGLAPTPPGTGIWGESVLLATLHLEAAAPGATILAASDDYPSDPTEGFAISPLLGGGFAPVVYEDGLVVVPSPSAGGLLLVGFLGIACRRRHAGRPRGPGQY
jgi:hypothetical protein